MKREIISFLGESKKYITNLKELKKCDELILEENGTEYHCMLKNVYSLGVGDVTMHFISTKLNDEGKIIGTVCNYKVHRQCDVVMILGVSNRELSKKYPVIHPYNRMPHAPYVYEMEIRCKIDKTGNITLVTNRYMAPTQIFIRDINLKRTSHI